MRKSTISRTVALLTVLAFTFWQGAFQAFAEATLFGAAYNGPDGPSTLYRIDPATGAGTPVGPIGFERCSGMDFGPTGILYATCERSDGSNTHVLVTINTTTGAGTQIGPTGVQFLQGTYQTYNTASDITFRNADHALYAYTFPGDGLATINTATGAMTQLGFPSGAGSYSGCICGFALAFSPADTLFMAMGDHLFTLDPVTSFATLVATISYPTTLVGADRLNSMKFGPNGVLSGTNKSGPDRSGKTFLVTVDTTTGAVTTKGVTVNGLDALAWLMDTAPSSLTANATPATVNESDSVSVSGTFTDPGTPDAHTVEIQWGDGSPAATINLAPGVLSYGPVTHQYLDDNPTGTASDVNLINVTVTDAAGPVSIGTAVTVNNVPPSVNAGGDQTINEGGSLSRSGSFTDPGTDTWAATVDYGDGTGVQSLSLSGKNFTLNHNYGDNGSFTVTVAVTDDDGGSGSATFHVTVNNVPPTATFNVPASVDEGNPINLALNSPHDPSAADTTTGFQYAFDCGNGSGYGSFGPGNSGSCPTSLYGTRTVKGKIRDKDSGVSEYTADVTIRQVVFPVQIDIKPGGTPNSINLKAKGTVPVAVLSTQTFDARTVDPGTVTFADAPVALKANGTPLASLEDVNGDSRLDLVLHFNAQALQLTPSDTEAVLKGKTFAGLSIQGVDSVRVIF